MQRFDIWNYNKISSISFLLLLFLNFYYIIYYTFFIPNILYITIIKSHIFMNFIGNFSHNTRSMEKYIKYTDNYNALYRI